MNDGIPNQPDPFPITADVLLNFTVYVEVDEANSSHVLKGRLQNYFGKAFAEKLMISHDRISDVNVVYAGNETFNTEVCKGCILLQKHAMELWQWLMIKLEDFFHANVAFTIFFFNFETHL